MLLLLLHALCGKSRLTGPPRAQLQGKVWQSPCDVAGVEQGGAGNGRECSRGRTPSATACGQCAGPVALPFPPGRLSPQVQRDPSKLPQPSSAPVQATIESSSKQLRDRPGRPGIWQTLEEIAALNHWDPHARASRTEFPVETINYHCRTRSHHENIVVCDRNPSLEFSSARHIEPLVMAAMAAAGPDHIRPAVQASPFHAI